MMARVTHRLSRAVDRVADDLLRGTPGCGPSAVAVGVGDAERDLVTRARGHVRALDDGGRPVAAAALSLDARFDVGSVTKVAVTTALCMRLVDRSRLRLDASVAQWFPGFSGGPKEAVTVRDLLEHQGGLWEWWPTYVDGARTSTDAVALVEGLPLRYPPRAGRHYSDLGFMLLGEIVAREYGEPLAAAARHEVFAPLGMCDTGYRARGEAASVDSHVATSLGDWYERRMVDSGSPYPVPVRSEAFTDWRTHTLVGEANDGNCWHAFGGVAGHAGLFTSAPDLLRLGRALLTSLDDDGPWSAATVADFCRPGRDARQGLGFRVAPGVSGPVVEHPGFPGARLAVLPRRRRVAVLLTNRLHTRGEPPAVDTAWTELVEAVEVG